MLDLDFTQSSIHANEKANQVFTLAYFPIQQYIYLIFRNVSCMSKPFCLLVSALLTTLKESYIILV